MARYAKLKKLVDVPEGRKITAAQVTKAAGAVAEALKKDRTARRFCFTVLERGKPTSFAIDHGGGASRSTKDAGGKADFEIRGSADTLGEIAAGRLSPVDAYLTGRLQVRGDLDYGKRVYARMAAAGRREL